MRISRDLLGNKRAITPVLSSLLLTVVAVAAMALATTATYVITTNLRENMSERAIVEDVLFSIYPRQICVYVNNIGKVAIHVSGVYVNHTRQATAPLNLEIANHDWLNVSLPWVSGDLFYVDIVTTRGTHLAENYEAP